MAASRWWSPDGPSLRPSPTDLARLVPGAEPDKDFGLALLTYHRVGAAACEAAAASPLVNEHLLTEYLVQARAQIAQPLVGAIAKSTSGASYAGLLVRDVADEAEQGALTLYRQAVAKGVSPTVAAQRVGQVYGTPYAQMGPYRALACTPAASPMALQDAADRVLFTYVEKMSALETREDIRKATAEYEREHNVTHSPADGRFVRLQDKADVAHLNALLNPPLTAERESSLVKPAQETPNHLDRLRRLRAMKNKKHQAYQRSAPTKTMTKNPQDKVLTRELTRDMTAKQKQLDRQLFAAKRGAPTGRVAQMTTPMSFVTGSTQSLELKRSIAHQDGSRILTADAISAVLGDGHIYGSVEEKRVYDATSEAMHDSNEYVSMDEAVITVLPNSLLLTGEAKVRAREDVVRRSLSWEKERELKASGDYDHYVRENAIAVDIVPAADMDGKSVLIYDDPQAQGIPSVHVLRVDSPYVQETTEGIALYGDAAYEIVGETRAFDTRRRVYRTETVLKPLDVFGKAEGYLERHNETQDAMGRFVRLRPQEANVRHLNDLLNPAPKNNLDQLRQRKQFKQRKQQRDQRAGAQRTKEMTRRPLERTAVKHTATDRQRQVLQRTLYRLDFTDAVPRSKALEVRIHDQADYKVMSGAQFTAFARLAGVEHEPMDYIEPYGRALEYLLSGSMLDSATTMTTLKVNVDENILNSQSADDTPSPLLQEPLVMGNDEEKFTDHLHNVIHNLFDEHPTLQRIDIEPDFDDDQMSFQLYGWHASGPRQTVVEFPHDFDPTRPFVMSYQGVYEQRRLHEDKINSLDEPDVRAFNDKVQVFKIVRPKAELWTAENDTAP